VNEGCDEKLTTKYNNETTPQYLVKHTMNYFTHTEAAEIKN
jgi:hypothetical protein